MPKKKEKRKMRVPGTKDNPHRREKRTPDDVREMFRKKKKGKTA